jgi:hypothetical protein
VCAFDRTNAPIASPAYGSQHDLPFDRTRVTFVRRPSLRRHTIGLSGVVAFTNR